MKLLSIGGKLLVIAGDQRICVPMGYSYNGVNVTLWSIDDTNISLTYPLEKVVDSSDNAFADIDTLEAFLIPILN